MRSSRPVGRPATAAIAATLLLVGCGGSLSGPEGPAPPSDLADRLTTILAERPLDRVHWGIVVAEAGSGRTVYELDGDLLFIPGSNAKVPVVAAALSELGEDFRWETSVYSRLRPVGGAIEGDLYLVGRGDPSLGPPFHGSGTTALRALADSLAAIGVERVEGRLLIDVSAWDSTSVPDSWMVEDLPVTAGATGGAFSISRGVLEIQITGAERAGAAPVVDWEPRGRTSGAPFVENALATDTVSARDIEAAFRPDPGRWRLEGSTPPGEVTTLRRSSRDPIRLSTATLHQALLDRGISIDDVDIAWDAGVSVEETCVTGSLPSCPGMLRLTGLASPPLSVLAAEILGPSQNWIAEQLLRTLGAEVGDGPGGWPSGTTAMSRFLIDRVGLSAEDFHLEDGSGLSNHNLISPGALVRLLRYARLQPWGETFHQALANPGEEGSTLEGRLEGLENRVAAKTGSLSHVNSLSGYVETSTGDTYVFSILSNGANVPASVVRAGIDRLVREIANP